MKAHLKVILCVIWMRFSHDKISPKPFSICLPEHFEVVVYVKSEEFSDLGPHFEINLIKCNSASI